MRAAACTTRAAAAASAAVRCPHRPVPAPAREPCAVWSERYGDDGVGVAGEGGGAPAGGAPPELHLRREERGSGEAEGHAYVSVWFRM